MATRRTNQVPRSNPADPPPHGPPVPPRYAVDAEEFWAEEEMTGDMAEEVREPDGTLPVGLAVMVVILLDVSGSLIAFADRVRAGFRRMLDNFRENTATKVSVDLLLVTFADRAKSSGFAPAGRFAPPELSFGGQTNLADALDTARAAVEARWREYAAAGVQLNKCLEFVVTDGHPTGEYKEAVKRNRVFEARNRRVEVFPVAAGDAAMPVLAELSGHREPLLLDECNWAEFFAWIYKSAEVVSGSLPGDQVDLPDVKAWMKTRRG